MKKNFIYLMVAMMLLVQCTPVFAKQEVAEKTALELRSLQTRIYDTNDEQMVQKAIIHTLQDNGFRIENIEDEMGFIRAQKEVKLKRTKKSRVVAYSLMESLDAAAIAICFGLNPSAMFNMYQVSMMMKNELAPHTVIFDTSILTETIGKKVEVRINLVEKVLENADGYTTVKASPRSVARHYEPAIYQAFFEQLDKNIFISNSKI